MILSLNQNKINQGLGVTSISIVLPLKTTINILKTVQKRVHGSDNRAGFRND